MEEEEEEGKKMEFVGYRYWIFGCCRVALFMDICMWPFSPWTRMLFDLLLVIR